MIVVCDHCNNIKIGPKFCFYLVIKMKSDLRTKFTLASYSEDLVETKKSLKSIFHEHLAQHVNTLFVSVEKQLSN